MLRQFPFLHYARGRKINLSPFFAVLCALITAYAPPVGGEQGAAEPPQAPILRIEAEMHTAKITRIAADAAGRYLATASEDKTVRIWELPGGRLLRVLRPPIGTGNEGKIHAVAMSPDGRTVACAGWTGLEWDGNFTVYFFDRASGRMLKRISGLPASINNLAFAPDGRVLVISLGGKRGVLFYRTTDDSLLAEDLDYGADTYGASFDGKGRLVTSSYDGFLRLYDVDFHLVTKAKLAEGARPYGVSFAPDGNKIAVGFENSSQVAITSGQDLKLLYTADTSGIKNVAFNAVAWGQNGQNLYAAGQYRVGEQHPIRKWDNQGQGMGIDLPAATNTIVHLAPLSTGGVAYGAADPAFGVFDGQDRRILHHGPPLADYRDGEPAFLLSNDGAAVQFSYERAGKAPTRFSIADRLLHQGSASSGLMPSKTTAAGLTFTPWKNAASVTVNGRALPLEQLELSRCLAITPDEQSFLLGTVWNLRLFDRQGRQLWQVSAPANVWSVNITGNGQIAVAAIADGTIRWYRMADGQELLALYPHPDRRRWTVWTPSGYYDAAPGAEALLGWHKNYRRATEADFFSVDRFRAVSYRPDVVARVLPAMDEQEALRLAQAALTAQAPAPASARPKVQPALPPQSPEGFMIKPMLYALVIGVSQYQDAVLTLPFAGKDAQDVAAALQRQEGSAYRGVKVTVLTDSQATKGKILDGLDWLDRETTSKDLALIFLGGHGVSDKNGISYFLPADVSLAHLRKTALPFSDLKNTVAALAGQPIILLDTCRHDERLSVSSCAAAINALADDLANSGRGAVVMTAAGRNQAVRDDQARGNGAFAKAVLDGLGSNVGGSSNGPVTITMLAAHVTEEVRTLTSGTQTPLTLVPPAAHDFLVAGMPGTTQAPPATAPAVAPGNPETQQNEILRRLPPVVTVLSPQDGAGINNTTVTVQYSVRSPSGEPVTEVLILVDGRPLPTQRGVSVVADVSAPQDMREIRVPVPERDSEISLLARNRWAISEPASVRVQWQGQRVAARAVAKPNLYVVAIGVSKYADPSLSLGLAAKDAHDLTEALKHQKGKLYEDVVVKLLTDTHATKESVLEALDWLDHQTTPTDVAVLFLAGHGVNDKSGAYYFLPHNAKTDQLRRTALPFSDIRNTMAYLSGKALLFADTCHSGDILGTRRAVADINAVVNELASAENGAIVFASSTGKQYALENPAWGNGAFTKALVEGLTGKAAYGQSNAITVNMLDLYLSERVKALTNGEQTPTTAKPHTIQDFPVAVKLS